MVVKVKAIQHNYWRNQKMEYTIFQDVLKDGCIKNIKALRSSNVIHYIAIKNETKKLHEISYFGRWDQRKIW
jgi:hypothetical protein